MRRLLAFLLVLPMPATAACPAANQFVFSFATAPAATLSYTSSYGYTATNGLGQSVSFTVSFVANGLSSSVVAGVQMPTISTLINDAGTTNRNLVIGGVFTGRTGSITSGTRTIATNLTFTAPVRDLEVQVNDIDFTANQFRDWFHGTGRNGADAYVPAIVTPHATNNGAGAKTAAASSLTLGPGTAPFNQTASEAIGSGSSENNANTGTLTVSWLQPVTSASLIYGNYPLSSGETATGQQGIGIQTVRFCPMPQLTTVKSSAPWSDPVNATTNPKLIPGGDLIYSITVANTDSSPAEGVVITDPLPANLIFFNGDIDDTGPQTANVEFLAGTSGLTLGTGAVAYSNNAGATYGYTPGAGYDAAVNALRVTPTGSMAANSSFTLRFRARIR